MELQAVELRELRASVALAPGARVVVEGLDVGATFVHGTVRTVDAEGQARVTLVAGCGDVAVPVERVRRVCGTCSDCRTLSYRPRCAYP